MRQRRRAGFRAILAALVGGSVVMPTLAPVGAQSLPEAAEAIGEARITTRILFVTAHPDDEWSSLLTYLSRGLNADVALLMITRGEGGQNAIGPEQGGELGVIRTEELLAAGKQYGVKQFFTRAPDFGYSKSAQQTLQVWGDLALEDMVRVIRTYRPEVVINGWGGVHSGHGQHQASGILVPQALAAAADPKKFPEQLAEGLVPWKVTLDLQLAREGTGNAVELPVNDVSPLWGKSYVDLGMEGHAQHRSQGTPAFFGNPFFRRPIFLIGEGKEGAAGSFDRALLADPLAALATQFRAFREMLDPALATADKELAEAERAVLTLNRPAGADDLAKAGLTIDDLKKAVRAKAPEESTDLLWELDRVSERIDRALYKTMEIAVEGQADRNELVAGESFHVEVRFTTTPQFSVHENVNVRSLTLPTGWKAEPEESKEKGTLKFVVQVPPNAKPPTSRSEAILPFPPPLVEVPLEFKIAGYAFTIREPVECVRATTTGIRTYPLELVPAVTLTVEPRQVMVPVSRASAPVKLLARVGYHGTKPVTISIGLDAPEGWTIGPVAPLEYSDSGDRLVRFVVTPPTRPAPGAYVLHPYARVGQETFRTSLEPIPTLPTRNWSEPADATVHVLDLIVPVGLRVGYVAAENDPLPEILRQLGIRVDLLDDVALAFGDLSRYDAVAVGIRAYELRSDLPSENRRLLDYVKRGGTLVVQYQRDFAWNKYQFAPFPAKIGQPAARVTDSNSPVRFLAPQSSLLNLPNKITPADFGGWVQERGLYFWGLFGAPYQAVLGLKDPGEAETTGALVYARYGKGVYVYTGLSFFRELPAGVPGAYRLFVNLLSQSQRKSPPHD